MANTNYPKGFECKGVPLRVNKYTSGAACYPGDLVTLNSSGLVVPVAAGGEILGLCMTYVSATSLPVLVADHPQQMLYAQSSATEIDAQTDVGNMFDILATAGNATYKTSRQQVDSSTVGTGTAQVQLLGIEEKPGNDLGQYVDVVVRINEHQFGDSNAGI